MPEPLFAPVPSGWKTETLGTLCAQGGGGIQTGPFGSQLHAADYVAAGIPSVMPVNIGDNRIVAAGIAQVSEEDAERLSRYRLRRGDIVYSRRGDVERRALVTALEDGWLCGTGCLRVRPGTAVDSVWLSYYLGYAPVRRWIVQHAVGATMPNLNTGILSRLPVTMPPCEYQRDVADALAALDAKIGGNGQVASRAIALAVSLLQAAAGRASAMPLSTAANVRKGLSYKGAGLAKSGMPMVNLANAAVFGGFKRSGWKYYTGDYKPRHLASGGDLLVANTDLTWKLEALGWPMLVPDDVEEALFSQDISIIDFEPEWRHLRLPTWAHLFTTEARQRIEGMAYGTTVARFAPEALTGLEVPVLDPLHPVLEQGEALLARAWAAERESMALAKLRDALLPALMSGRLRVREAEELVEEAV